MEAAPPLAPAHLPRPASPRCSPSTNSLNNCCALAALYCCWHHVLAAGGAGGHQQCGGVRRNHLPREWRAGSEEGVQCRRQCWRRSRGNQHTRTAPPAPWEALPRTWAAAACWRPSALPAPQLHSLAWQLCLRWRLPLPTGLRPPPASLQVAETLPPAILEKIKPVRCSVKCRSNERGPLHSQPPGGTSLQRPPRLRWVRRTGGV